MSFLFITDACVDLTIVLAWYWQISCISQVHVELLTLLCNFEGKRGFITPMIVSMIGLELYMCIPFILHGVAFCDKNRIPNHQCIAISLTLRTLFRTFHEISYIQNDRYLVKCKLMAVLYLYSNIEIMLLMAQQTIHHLEHSCKYFHICQRVYHLVFYSQTSTITKEMDSIHLHENIVIMFQPTLSIILNGILPPMKTVLKIEQIPECFHL